MSTISRSRRRESSARISYAAPEDGRAKRGVIRLVERLSGQGALARLYERARGELRPGEDIFSLAVRTLGVRPRYDAARLAAVPREGPLVVVANHPFGVLDGLVLCHLVSMLRRDVKVVAMSTLCRVPEIREHVLPINFAGTPEAVATSARSRRAARALLAAGGALVIFPAGAVSTAPRAFGRAVDAPWHPFVGRLVLGSGAAVLPVRFEGQNSRLFQLASHVSPTLRLALLMGEARSRMGTEIELHLGDVLPFEALRGLAEPQALVDHLRSVTDATSSTLPPGPRPRASRIGRRPEVPGRGHDGRSTPSTPARPGPGPGPAGPGARPLTGSDAAPTPAT